MAGYAIIVGRERPEKVLVSNVDKGGQPTGPVIAERHLSVGIHQILNRARVWAIRTFAGVKDEDHPVQVTHPKYKGELKFLDWGTHGGYAVDVRYLAQSTSLDYEYQVNVQKLTVDSNTGAAFLELDSGENRFDEKKDALLIQFLKVYPQNRDSRSKNPDNPIKGYQYHEVNESTIGKSFVDRIETREKALRFVMELSDDEAQINNLFTVVGQRQEMGDVDELSQTGQKYEALLKYAELNPKDIREAVNAYKAKVREWFTKAEAYKALDLTKDGFIVFFGPNNKKEILWQDLEGKGEKMIDWVLENVLRKGVFEQTKTLKDLVDKLK